MKSKQLIKFVAKDKVHLEALDGICKHLVDDFELEVEVTNPDMVALLRDMVAEHLMVNHLTRSDSPMGVN